MVVSDGLPERWPSEIEEIRSTVIEGEGLRSSCSLGFPANPCDLGFHSTDDRFDFVVFGDSHAEAILPAIDEAALAAGLSGTAATAASCPPLLHIERVDRTLELRQRCQTVHVELLKFLEKNPHLKTVILSARWALAFEGRRVPGEAGADAILANFTDASNPNPMNNPEYFSRGLRNTLDALVKHDVNVVIIGNVPEIGWHVPDSLSRHIAFGDSLPYPPTRSTIDSRIRRSEHVLATFAAEQKSVTYLPLARIACPDQCITHLEMIPFYRDDDHLTSAGAKYFLAGPLKQIFTEASVDR